MGYGYVECKMEFDNGTYDNYGGDLVYAVRELHDHKIR